MALSQHGIMTHMVGIHAVFHNDIAKDKRWCVFATASLWLINFFRDLNSNSNIDFNSENQKITGNLINIAPRNFKKVA